jgi:hypothetical protein
MAGTQLHGQGGHSLDGLDGLLLIIHTSLDLSHIHSFKKGFNRANWVLNTNPAYSVGDFIGFIQTPAKLSDCQS